MNDQRGIVTGNRKVLKNPVHIRVLHNNKLIFDRSFETYPIVIGRGSTCDVPLPQFEFISRQHAVINIENDQLQILDLNSSNGIYFHGQKFKSAPIDEETHVSIGEVLISINPVATEDHTQVDEKTASIEIRTLGDIKASLEINENKIDLPADFISPSQVRKISHTNDSIKTDKTDKVQKEDLPKASPTIPADTPKFEPKILEKPKSVVHKPNPIQRTGKPKEHKPQHKQQIQAATSNTGHDAHTPIVDLHGIDQITIHPLANDLKPHHRVLEGYVTWKDTIYDCQHFLPGEKITLGRGYRADLAVPTLHRNLKIAKYDGLSTECYIPKDYNISILRDNNVITMDDLIASNAIVTKRNGYTLKLGNRELCSIKISDEISVHLRYAPAPRQLSKKDLIEASEEFKKATIVSGIFHLMLALLALFNAPDSHAPKIKNVPERYARLLVEPPRKLIEPPKPKKKDPEKVVEKKKEPVKEPKKERPKIVKRMQPVPKKVKLTKPIPAKNVAQLPAKKEPVKVENIGALGALTALSPKAAPTNIPVAININPNAGGMTTKNPTGGVIGVLKTKTGSLAAGGAISSVKTKGLGYGTGTGYGIQGLKGTAGTRGVAGTVVGTPSLMESGKNEGLTRTQVMDVVKRHLGEIQQCYERSLFQNPNLAGRVQYEWEIKASGTVSWAKVTKSDIGDADNLNSCVKGVFKKMKFPVAKNGQTTTPNIGFPFGRL